MSVALVFPLLLFDILKMKIARLSTHIKNHRMLKISTWEEGDTVNWGDFENRVTLATFKFFVQSLAELILHKTITEF